MKLLHLGYELKIYFICVFQKYLFTYFDNKSGQLSTFKLIKCEECLERKYLNDPLFVILKMWRKKFHKVMTDKLLRYLCFTDIFQIKNYYQNYVWYVDWGLLEPLFILKG